MHKFLNRFLFKTALLALLVSLTVPGFTNAALSDAEKGVGNVFTASTVNIDLTQSSGAPLSTNFFTETIVNEAVMTREFKVKNASDALVFYFVSVINTSGVCSGFKFTALKNSAQQYQGSISNTAVLGPFVLGSTDGWKMEVKGIPTTVTVGQCNFELLFAAAANQSLTGFVDTESISGKINYETAPTLAMELNSVKTKIAFTLKNILEFETAEYVLTYETNKGTKGAQGTLSLGDNTELTHEILLGTCSDLGIVCTYDQQVHDVQLSVTLHQDGATRVLTTSLL